VKFMKQPYIPYPLSFSICIGIEHLSISVTEKGSNTRPRNKTFHMVVTVFYIEVLPFPSKFPKDCHW
jgi:hypothetical protein